MTATYGVPITGRVPEHLKDAVRDAVDAGAYPDLSTVVRLGVALALRLGERRTRTLLAEAPAGLFPDLFAEGRTASHHDGPDTERAATRRASRSAGNGRLEVLKLAWAAGPSGITADEIVVALGARYAVNGLPRRVTDLHQAGAIEPKLDHSHAVATRPTRAGAPARVYVMTEKGRAMLAAASNGSTP